MVPREQGTRPNVIWIFGDQHRPQAMGNMGDPNLHTPNLDRMVAEGLQFRNAYAGAPICSPFRGTLLTGRYAHQCVPINGAPLPEGQPTISHMLRDRGYQTCYLGKWHVAGTENRTGGWKKLVPEWQRAAWDEWVGYDNNNKQWDCWVHGGLGKDFFHSRLDGFETDVLTDMLIERVRNWGKQQAEDAGAKPFFAVLSVQPPHSPYVAPEEWMARHTPGEIQLRPNVPPVQWVRDRARRELAGYYAQIENIDWNVGRVMNALHETGLYQNTVVMFFSDHGDMHGCQGRFNKNTPYQEAAMMPMIIWGERVKYGSGGGIKDDIFNYTDIVPTTLGLAGIETPAELPGFDFSRYWVQRELDDTPPDAALLGNYGHRGLPQWRAVVTRDWKYAVMPGQPWLLYDLRNDPYETHNCVWLSTWYPQRRQLHDRLAQMLKDVGDDFPMPEIYD